MNRGIAVVVVLIATTFVLLTVIATAGFSALNARSSLANERVAYQALLAAESGLDTVTARLNYRGGADGLAHYINTNLGTLDLGNGSRATLSATLNGNVVTVRSVGTAPGGSKTVLADFVIRRSNPSAAIPAALTSWPNVEVRGNAVVESKTSTWNGVIPNMVTTATAINTTLSPTTATFQTRFTSTAGIFANQYIRLGTDTRTYRIDTLDDLGNATLTTISPPTTSTPLSRAAGTQVGLVQFGFRSFFANNQINLTDVSGFLTGMSINVGGYLATVTAVDRVNNRLTVSWSSSPAPTSADLVEGTAVIPSVLGAISWGTVATSGQGQVIGGSQNSSPMLADRSRIFEQTFYMTKDEFRETTPSVSSSNVTISAQNPVNGLLYVRGNLGLQGNASLCGSGILVVEGNLTVNGTCSTGFDGIIYVMGDYDQQGNSTIDGAIVTEGRADINQPSTDPTKIAGTGQSDGKITYDPGEVYRKMQLLSQIRLIPQQGSWRQR